MIQTIDLAGFLTLGLLGGFGHCVGMCSPFVLFVSRRYVPAGGGRAAVVAAQLWYTTGRIVTYAVLGAAAGALGGVVEFAGGLVGFQRAASVVAGSVLVVWALVALSDLVPRRGTGGTLFTRVAGVLKGRVPGHPFATGLFLGLSVADDLLARNRAMVNRLSQAFLLAMGIWFLSNGLVGPR